MNVQKQRLRASGRSLDHYDALLSQYIEDIVQQRRQHILPQRGTRRL